MQVLDSRAFNESTFDASAFDKSTFDASTFDTNTFAHWIRKFLNDEVGGNLQFSFQKLKIKNKWIKIIKYTYKIVKCTIYT